MDPLPSPSNDPPLVSAVVCTRNRGDRVVATLESILANDYPCFEVILVDQSSEPDTEAAVSKFFRDPRFRYKHTATKGAGHARNIGLAAAKGEFVLYTDDDCIVPENWISTISTVFLQHERVAVVFCNVKAAPHDSELGFIPTYDRRDEKLVKNLIDKCTARGIGAGMALRKNAARQIGGFDVCLGPGSIFQACEEGDIAVRLLLQGWQIYETNRVAIVHEGFRTWQEGKELTRRNWFGIGAAYVKPLRCGRIDFAVVALYEAFWVGLLQPLALIFQFKRPSGLKKFFYFWEGFFRGLRMPLDCRTITYRDNASAVSGQ